MKSLDGNEYFLSEKTTIRIEEKPIQNEGQEYFTDFWEIMFVQEGTGIHLLNDQAYILTTGTFCFIRSGDHYSFENTNHLTLVNIVYRSPQGFRFLHDITCLLPVMAPLRQQTHWQLSDKTMQQAKIALHAIDDLTNGTLDENIAAAEGMFLQLIITLHKIYSKAPGDEKNDRQLQNLLSWLQRNYRDSVDWTRVAEQFSLPLRTLHRQIKQRTGMTPHRYVMLLRLLEARRQLKETSQPIEEIAHACGFSNRSHFSTQFRKQFSQSPKRFR